MGSPLWPSWVGVDDVDAALADDATLAPGVEVICAAHGLDASSRVRFRAGSLPVYAVGADHVLKLFPPDQGPFWATEQAALLAVAGRLPVPTPRPIAADSVEGWFYLLMGRLPGRPLEEVWPRLDPSVRIRLAHDLGAALAVLHGLQVPEGPLRVDWAEFVRVQAQTAAERQRTRGVDSAWVDQIPGFLDRVRVPDVPRGLLHTEVMLAHLLVEGDETSPRLSGLVDFEPSMVGAVDYEWASVGLFVSQGEPAVLRAALEGYGAADEASVALSRRFMAHALLHRYARLDWYLERVPVGPEVRTLEALAEAWFGC